MATTLSYLQASASSASYALAPSIVNIHRALAAPTAIGWEDDDYGNSEEEEKEEEEEEAAPGPAPFVAAMMQAKGMLQCSSDSNEVTAFKGLFVRQASARTTTTPGTFRGGGGPFRAGESGVRRRCRRSAPRGRTRWATATCTFLEIQSDVYRKAILFVRSCIACMITGDWWNAVLCIPDRQMQCVASLLLQNWLRRLRDLERRLVFCNLISNVSKVRLFRKRG